MASKRADALKLAEEVLSDIELGRFPATQIALKCARLARLLDDVEAMKWLHYEIAGFDYAGDNIFTSEAFAAGLRSNRGVRGESGEQLMQPAPLGQLEAAVDAARTRLAAAVDAPVSITSANPNQHVVAPRGNAQERQAAHKALVDSSALLQRVTGALYEYASARYHELRFGSAVETSFEVVRDIVDGQIAMIVPDALMELSAAFENAASDNPAQWRNAAAACRRLLKAVADALRSPGEDVGGRKMGPDNYINRLIDWVVARSESETLRDLVVADLEFLGRRLDAAAGAGHKGAHADVSRFEASRYVTGTYLLLGDVLRFIDESG
jgi:hypothetical protein